jgi:hypothetical protein
MRMSDNSYNELSEAPPMSTASPEIQDLARRLLAFEAARDNTFDARVDVAVQVIEELRMRLIRLAGVDGFRSLLSRALTLAKAEVPSLAVVQVRAEGSLEGFEGIEAEPGGGGGRAGRNNSRGPLAGTAGDLRWRTSDPDAGA